MLEIRVEFVMHLYRAAAAATAPRRRRRLR